MDPVAATTSTAANALATSKPDAKTRLTAYHVYGSGDHRLFIGLPPKTGGTPAP